MANTDVLYAGMPIGPGSDVAVKNTEAATAMIAGDIVSLDTVHPFSATQQTPGVLLGVADIYCYGVMLEACAVGAIARCRTSGRAVIRAASDNAAVITIGDVVQVGAVSGRAKTRVTLKAALGVSLGPTTATAADTFVVDIRPTPAA